MAPQTKDRHDGQNKTFKNGSHSRPNYQRYRFKNYTQSYKNSERKNNVKLQISFEETQNVQCPNNDIYWKKQKTIAKKIEVKNMVIYLHVFSIYYLHIVLINTTIKINCIAILSTLPPAILSTLQ